MGDFKILILAYLIGNSPVETQQYFQMEGWFNTMEDCKKELLKQKPDGRYEVMNEFVIDGDFKWDWLLAGCKSDTTGEEFQVLPSYPKGKPKELEELEFDLNEMKV
jgi:hypothetical protein